MNKLTIPAILAVIVLSAGVFAFMPINQASTVHTTILASNTGIVSVQALDISNANANFSCDDDGDDGAITFTLDVGTDSAELVSLFIDTNVATDGGDFLDVAINADGVEVLEAARIDAAPSGDTEFMSAFSEDGSNEGEGNIGPLVFSDTLVLTIGCEEDDGNFTYNFVGIFKAPGGATTN